MRAGGLRRGRHHGGARAAKALFVATLLGPLAACSEVPDWANPVEWYDGTVDAVGSVFEDEPEALPPPEGGEAQTLEALAAAEPEAVPGAEEAFPNLATVPAQPPAVTPPEDVERLMTGLAADRQNAQYTDEILRGESLPQTASNLDQLPPTPYADVPVTSAPLPETAASSAASSGAVAQAEPLPPQPAATTPGAAEAASLAPLSGSGGEPVGIDRFKQAFNQAFTASAASTYSGSGESVPALMPGSAIMESGGAPASSAPSVKFLAGVVYFGDGQAWLSNQDRRLLGDIVTLHRRTGGLVHVVGHASQRTRDMEYGSHKRANLEISSERAQIVVDDLIRQGVPAERIVVTAAGDDRPAAYEFMPGGEAENRRAEIFVEY